MTRATREYIPDRPAAGPSTFSVGFTKLIVCTQCRVRRSFTQFAAGSSICNRCAPAPK